VNILDFYKDIDKHEELKQLFVLGAQQHPAGLPANFLEKDVWVTEILRLLYDEQQMGEFAIAFKGGTALSKCWKAIDRFSEDIDLSIHWADLADASDEAAAWEQSNKSRSQQKKFRDRQTTRLTEWSTALVERLNTRLAEYEIEGLSSVLEDGSKGEKIDILFPRVTAGSNDYQLDHVLLEFGGRNRGQPTEPHAVDCYMSEVPAFGELVFPEANVQAYDPAYILWEKLTALHQFSTMEKEPATNRLARHWYDVDCILQKGISDPLNTEKAMNDVIEMKSQRWPERGVDYGLVARGGLQLIPSEERLKGIEKDHQEAINGGMFYGYPDNFDSIIERLRVAQDGINEKSTGN